MKGLWRMANKPIVDFEAIKNNLSDVSKPIQVLNEKAEITDQEVFDSFSDDDLVDHLNDFLDHPQRCPHGGLIPGNGQGETDADDKLLSMIPDGTKVQIVRVSDNYDFLQYFGSLNLEIDDTIEVVKHEKFDNSLVVKKADGSNLTIGAKAIDYIFVETR